MTKEKKHGWNYKYPSVTTMLGVLRKCGLEFWYKFNTAAFCDEEGKKGREAGADIHTVIQQYIEGNEMTIDTKYPDEVNNAVKSFLKFKEENTELKLHRAEVQLDCDKYAYSGCTDCLAEKDGKKYIVDWKSGKKNKKGKLVIYDEYVYQVAMYVMAYELQFNCKLDGGVIALFDKHEVDYITKEVSREEIEEVFKEVCMPIISIYTYQHRRKK